MADNTQYIINSLKSLVELSNNIDTKMKLDGLVKRLNVQIADKELTTDEVILYMEGKKIRCIKSIKERTGLGLKDSKAIVDNFCLETWRLTSQD